MNEELKRIRLKKTVWVRDLFRLPNVVSVGVGFKETAGRRTNELCVVVGVAKKMPPQDLKPTDFVPKELGDNIRTDVVETGVIKTIQANPRTKWRPAPGGVSIGHPEITCGTLGTWVLKDNKPMILSNNHILANTNNADIGDAILQPGNYDGGTSNDVIAHLHSFVEVHFDGRANWVDAALAWAESKYVDDSVLEIGEVLNTRAGFLGMKIQKYGRTTGLTIDEITQVDVTVEVDYGRGQTALFVSQFMAGGMSAGGDSGSLVTTYTELPPPQTGCWFGRLLDNSANTLLSAARSHARVQVYHKKRDVTERAVGLLFAGSQDTTVINPISNVQSALGGFTV